MGDLQEINGLGNTAESQLNEIGITTVNELANAPLEKLEEAGIRSAEKIHSRAQKMGISIDSGVEVEEEEENARYISTGLQDMDKMLGGGFRGGFLVGIAGESKVGKTQFALQALASAADYTDGHAVYIETEPGRFSVSRIKDLCRKDDSYKRIHRIQAYEEDDEVDNLKVQRNSYDAIKETFDNVSMVVLDSFVANFRLSGKFTGRADLPARNEEIADHLQGLQSLASEFDCPVLMTLQVMGNPDQYSGGDVNIWGSVLMDHTITYLLFLSHAKGELKEVEMLGNPSLPDDSVMLKIPENDSIETA
jgi:RecA/RadA recombinase